MAGRRTRKKREEHVSFFYQNTQLGLSIRFTHVPGGYTSVHYHDSVEIVYPLNGDASIQVEGKTYNLPKRQVTVVGAGKLHSTHTHDTWGMALAIHVTKQALVSIIPDIESYHLNCIPDEVTTEQFPAYRELCEIMEKITRSYISGKGAFEMEACGLILQAIALLIQNFSVSDISGTKTSAAAASEPIRQTIRYVEENFKEIITLDDVCELTGYGKESFCRLFKRKMGMSFLKYLNEVRLTHCCHELAATDDPISMIMERNGIRGQKQFNASFKALYGMTPSEIRKQAYASTNAKEMPEDPAVV
ncbi:MAG: AraC family transcriptional regulator [Eubacteriales bacterium]|nr:AraC family transcriptional regulator [Eubacteriales bacterium]